MTVRELCERLSIPVPEGPFADYVIFVNGLPVFDEIEVDHMARIVYLKS